MHIHHSKNRLRMARALETAQQMVPEGSLEGFRTLPDEEDVARQLLASLDESQLELAVIGESAPPDIITQWEPRIRLDDPAGIAVQDWFHATLAGDIWGDI